METKEILSTQFSEFTAITKDLINNGDFFLYSIQSEKYPDINYLLSTDKFYYLVSDNGAPISKLDKLDDKEITLVARNLFSDIKKSVSNELNIEWA